MSVNYTQVNDGGRISQIIEKLNSNDDQIRVNAMKEFRKIIDVENEINCGTEEIIQSGIVTKLVEFLKMDDHSDLQFEACWSLTNVAAGTSEETKTVVDAGAVPILLKLINCEREDIQEQAVWTLSNIIGDGPEYRDLILKEGIMVPLLRFLWKSEKTYAIEIAVSALVNLCRMKTVAPDNYAKLSVCLPILSCMLFHNDKEILINTCWALLYFNEIPEARGNIEPILDLGVCKRLVELLTYPHLPVVECALRMLDTFAVHDDDKYAQMIIDLSALPKLLDLLNFPEEIPCRADTCHLISNIVCGNRNQKQAVIDTGIVPVLINILDKGETLEKKSAAEAVAKLPIGATRRQLRYIVTQGCIPHMINMLADEDFELVGFVLRSLIVILRRGNMQVVLDDGPKSFREIIKDCKGFEKIVALQNHPVYDVKDAADYIIDIFFSQESVTLSN